MSSEQAVREIALRAREASYELALATRGVKDAAKIRAFVEAVRSIP